MYLAKLTDVRIVGNRVDATLIHGRFFKDRLLVHKWVNAKGWWVDAEEHAFYIFSHSQNKRLEELYNRAAYED